MIEKPGVVIAVNCVVNLNDIGANINGFIDVAMKMFVEKFRGKFLR